MKGIITKELLDDFAKGLDDLPLDEAIIKIQDFIEENKNKYFNLYFKYDYGWDNDRHLTIYGDRLETDEEYQYRTNLENSEKLEKERYELQEYNRLKEKFEKGN